MPSTGTTETAGAGVPPEAEGCTLAVVAVALVAVGCSEASAGPGPQPAGAAAGATPGTAGTPRRDHPRARCSDRFDMCGTPTARLPEMSTFVRALCDSRLGGSWGSQGGG
ncbi:hypothetical protein AB0N31_18750 [Streptomyces sp. NPDC051051]|uniref:hypothetical protein n=1 Tax=Streptomyces sp. NPDC051051 TaxID=3155666 RepID=UPI00343E6DDC